jgi:hypothetical protein
MSRQKRRLRSRSLGRSRTRLLLQARIGMSPSSATRKAARDGAPPRPAVNAWKIDSPLSPSAPLWQQMGALRELIAPASGKISAICQGEPAARLQIIRECSGRVALR